MVCFQMKMSVFQVEYFSSECDKTSDGCDVNKAAEEMWAKYQIHQRQVDGCDLVQNLLPSVLEEHNGDNRVYFRW